VISGMGMRLGADRDRAVRILAAASLAALLVGSGWLWIASRWKSPPSIFDSPVDNVLGYFTTPDFNRLTVEERVRYVQQFVGRFRGMSQQDSVVAAAFLAGVTGKVREQLTQNVRILAKDILAEGAQTRRSSRARGPRRAAARSGSASA
jgi:hypothetical protein